MRFIDKSYRSVDFDVFVESYKGRLKSKKWEGLKKMDSATPTGREIQLILYQHLWQEQKGLCIYCEQQLEEKLASTDQDFSHIEHIKPKKLHKDLTFEQSNLTVSCDGFDTRNKNPETQKDFCGHKKLRKYDENLFLNPLEIQNIEDFFDYDIEGNMFPAKNLAVSDLAKAVYTIDLLNLQHETLIFMRKEQYELILNDFMASETEQEQNAYLDDLLDPNYDRYPAFYSMLKKLFER